MMISNNVDNLNRALLVWLLYNGVQRNELRDAIKEFREDFKWMDIDHLLLLKKRLEAGQIDGIDGSSYMIRRINKGSRSQIQNMSKEDLYGDFFSTIGEEIRFANGYEFDVNSIYYLTAYEIFENEYPNGIKSVDGIHLSGWVDWMRKINFGQTPANNEIVRQFHKAIEELLSLKLGEA